MTLRQASLCFLVKNGEVLLALKKSGFGASKWNGVGGKPEPDETIEATAIRETEEEIGVTPKSLKRVATLNFSYFRKDWDQQVCVFLVDKWIGSPVETTEMAPAWFNVKKLPFEKMWADDIHWLPNVLAGDLLNGDFVFDENQNLKSFEIRKGSF